MDAHERLKRRADREKAARLEAEEIADSRLADLNAERASLAEQIEIQARDLRKALGLVEASRLRMSHDVLWEIGEAFNGAGYQDAEKTINAAISALGVACGAISTSVWEIDLHSYTAKPTSRWVADGPLNELVTTLDNHKISPSFLDNLIHVEEGSYLTFKSDEISEMLPDLGKSIENPWSLLPDASVSAGLVSKSSGILTIITVFTINSSERVNSLDYVLRGTMMLLRQFIHRIDLESQLLSMNLKQAEVHLTFMKSASKLMLASSEDLDTLVEEVMEETATILGAPSITDWLVDYETQTFTRTRMFRSPAVADREIVPSVNFGDAEFLDATCKNNSTTHSLPEMPTLAQPSKVAIVRGTSEQPSAVLLAARLNREPWSDAEIEILERLSSLLLAIETRLASDSRANAVLHSSPLPIVLRKATNFELIDCNAAFLKMTGCPSVDEIRGTPPSTVLYEKAEEVDQRHHSSSAWMFEEVSRGRMDGAPTRAVYKGPEGTPVLAQIRCMKLTPAHAEPFLLIHVENITEQRASAKKLQTYSDHLAHIADHDDLPGLMNRRGTLRRIAEIDEESGHGALLVIDLDRFKNVNDSLGHATGNGLLQAVARRLEKNIRPGDAVGRLSGDEFLVVLGGPVSEAEAIEIGNKLIDKVGAAAIIGGHRLYPSPSIGVAFWNSDVEASAAFLHADTAMYKAKHAGGRRLTVFDKSLQIEVESKQLLEAELQEGLEQDEFCVHYQPVISLLTGGIIGAEALVRWQHPRRGLLAAGTFIEAAEEMGFAADIGSRVLRQACIDAAAWPQGSTPIALSANIAASQIADGLSLSKEVTTVLMETGLETDRLNLEVTESALIEDLEQAVETIADLSRRGVRFSLDDFGTGYSSLAYLKRLKVDSLKIDKSFVSDLMTDPDSVKFVTSILALAHTLKLDVIAEGVETQEQAEMLRSLGCTKAQGWLYYKALPNDDLQALLQAQAAAL